MKALAELLGESPAIEAVREKIERLLKHQRGARRVPPILLEGETGTGKGLLARMIHRLGPRSAGPFIDVNCAAIPEALLEAEMFGFERGAFTDARRAKPGMFQAANRGTLFLDEVGLLSEALQAKFLKVLEEQSVRRLGSTRDEPVDVAILTATNEDLSAAVRERRFRGDLYHRLAVLTLSLPPLRERGTDVLRLAEHFMERACADYGVPPKTLAPDARAALLAYAWPGNVRELVNLIERIVLLAPGDLVTAGTLGLPPPPPTLVVPAGETIAARSLEDAMRQRVADALQQAHWNISKTATILGISRNTLRARIDKYALRQGDAPARARPRAAATSSPSPLPAAAPVVPAGTAAPLRWERRRVALLRAVFVPAEDDLGAPLEASRTLDTILEKIASFGGRVEGISPTGAIAAFGLEAPGDALDRAAHCATAIQKAAERAQLELGVQLGIKLGLHVSQEMVELTGSGGGIVLEARERLWPLLNELVRPAEANTIVVTEAAVPFLRRRFDIVPAAAPKTYRLVGRERIGLHLGGRLTRFVGRGPELEMLRSRLDSAKRGEGQVVGIGGEAGIGKSRLVLEFRQGLAGQMVEYMEGHCRSYRGSVPYLPVQDLVRATCGLADSDTPEAIARKIRLALAGAGMDADAEAPYLLQMLGVKEGADGLAPLSPEAVKARLYEILTRLLLRRSLEAPLVIVLEDLHWIDPASEEFFASFARHVSGARVLLVSTYRWGYQPPWIEKSSTDQLALEPLPAAESMSLMQSVLATREVPEPVARLILAKAEGNPFFIEELALTATERGDLPLDGGVPETIQDVLLARIERLPDGAKRLLQAASVLGRETTLVLLRAVWDGPEDLDELLRELDRFEFLHPSEAAEEAVCVFRHSLTQEVSYESLAPARRQALHEAGGRAIESLYADRLEEACGRLAYHFERTRDDDKAIRYLTMSAERSARSYAHLEAVEALRSARTRVERLADSPDRERRVLELALRESHSLHVLGRFVETRDLLLQYQERVDRLADPAYAGPFHFWLGRTHSLLGDRERTGPSVRRAVEIARTCGDTATLGKAHFMLAYEDYWSGQPVQGVAHGREAISLLERTDERWWQGMAQWVVALNCIPLGDFEAGLRATERGNAIGEEIGDLRLQNYAAWTQGWIEATRGEWERGVEACQRARDRSQDPVNSAYAIGQLGYAYLEGGDAARAIPLLEQAIGWFMRSHVRQTSGRFMASLSEAYLATGQLDHAERLAAQSFEISREVEFLYAVGLAERVAGKVLQARGDLEEAGRRLEGALETFSAMRASYELARTQLALAELAHARRDAPATARHLGEAVTAFRSLRVPRYEARVERLASAWNISLPAASTAGSP